MREDSQQQLPHQRSTRGQERNDGDADGGAARAGLGPLARDAGLHRASAGSTERVQNDAAEHSDGILWLTRGRSWIRPAVSCAQAVAPAYDAEYKGSMRVKTSITLSEHALAAVDRLAGKQSSRSRVIEAAIEAYVAERARATRDARDRAILDAIAPEVADEMLDVLSYQADV